MNNYDPKSIESKWQKYWEDNNSFKTPEDATAQNKYYILPQLPYPSGSGLHVGHAEVYTACDIFARYQRMTGKKVLQVIGWDSFGLPAENYAIKTNVHPKKSTDDAVNNFRSQIKALGISVDWDREVGSHNADYYKWTQWFFLLFYNRGLAYRKMQSVNWCESCKTVLANDQVKEGKCERCDTTIIQKEMEQWYIKITDYAERLLQDIEKLDWPEETKKRQADWIGRSEGAEIKFELTTHESNDGIRNTNSTKLRNHIEVFTTRPDTLFGATYMVLAPEHQMVQDLKDNIENWDEVATYIEETSKKTDLDRQVEKEKNGVELKGIKAINPATNDEIPVWIADFVLVSYGSGAIFADAHDERDFEFAKKYNIPLKITILPDDKELAEQVENLEVCYTGDGVHFNSEFIDGLRNKEAITKMISWLEEQKIGKRKIQYKLRDWSVSRQRFWGAPIPMLRNEQTGELKPIPESDLPVILPNDVDFKPTGQSPLTYSEDFQKGVEEKYGEGWKREPDTLDTFMCSSWYYYRYLDPKNDTAFASPEALKKWMPVDFYLGGPEHVNGHLLYSRFFTKVLYDAGYIDFDEPFRVHRHQGLILGPDNKKMSKRWGNVINPTDVVNEFGADTMRMYEMFMGPLEDDKPWDTNGVKGVRRFLEKVWNLQSHLTTVSPDHLTTETPNYLTTHVEKKLHQTIKKVGEDLAKLQFNTAIAKMMELVNEMVKVEKLSVTHYELLILILSPFAPHMSEELWQSFGHRDSISAQSWPHYDESKLIEDEITVVVQVNGKIRAELRVSPDISEDEIKKLALAHESVAKWFEGKEVKKVIYVKGKLVSIVT